MKNFRIIIMLAVIAFSAVSAYAQKSNSNTLSSYEIKFKINGISDTVIYIGHYLGDKKYVVDTVSLDSKGYGVMKGNKDIKKGIYLVVLPSKNMTYFEFLMGDTNDRNFSIETDTTNFVTCMKVKGSKQNVAFNDYQRKMGVFSEKRTALEKEYKAAQSKESKDSIRDKFTALDKERVQFMNKLEKENQNSFFAKVLRSMYDVDIPDFPRDEQGNITDSTFQYRYYKKHYFDFIDFNEEGIIRTPIYEARLDYFFEKMVVPDPDSIIPDVHKVIDIAYHGDSLVYKYTLSHLFDHFQESKIMGYDAIFVAIAEDWYLSGKAPWADSTFLSKVQERVEKITPTRLGSIAYNLRNMQSVDERYYTLHDIKSDYTILVFWEPSCGHCKKEVPKLITEYRDTLKDLGATVFAIYTQYDREEWEKFIEEKNIQEKGWINVWDGPRPHSRFRDYYDIYSTPVIYVLDKDKKIIGKRLTVENIKGLIMFDKNKHKNQNKQ